MDGSMDMNRYMNTYLPMGVRTAEKRLAKQARRAGRRQMAGSACSRNAVTIGITACTQK